MLLSSYVNTNI